MKTILISGKSGHGKDTIGNMLKKEYESRGQKTLIIHFGDPVKWLARQVWNWDGNKEQQGRAILQYVGTTLMRESFPTYWAEIIAKFIYALNQKKEYDVCIIPDWRFINEYQEIWDTLIKCSEIYTIRIERYEGDNFYKNPNMSYTQFFHISERELDTFNFHYIVENHTDLKELEDSAKIIVKDIEGESNELL